jgi:hypothetical protein
MEVKFINNKANIEGLTFRQLALIEALVNEASMAGGYLIDIDDYKNIMKGFKTFDIKDVFNLEEEKREIEESVRKIMQESEVKAFRELYNAIQQCKDDEVRTLRLRDLMTEMEGRFSIPLLKDEEYNQANLKVMELYLEVSNARY